MGKVERRRVPVRELSRHTAALSDAVAAGESIEVTQDGVPVAMLSPLEPADRDIRAAIAIGLLDASVMDESHGAGAADALERLRAVRRDAEGRGPGTVAALKLGHGVSWLVTYDKRQGEAAADAGLPVASPRQGAGGRAADPDQEVLDALPVRLRREWGAGGRVVSLRCQAGHPGLDVRPGDFAAFDGQQGSALVAHVDRQGARAEYVACAHQQAEQVHRVFPAGRSVEADVGFQLLALAQRVARERLVDLAGEERAAQGEEFTAGVVDVLDEGEWRHSRMLGFARRASSQKRSSSQLNCSSAGPSMCVGGLTKRQKRGVGARNTPRRSVSLVSVARPKAREPITQA